MTENIRFTGIYSAMCTPYDETGALNEAMIQKLVEYQVAAEVDGIWICGGSAEATLLSNDERKRILELAVAAAAGRVKIMAHVGALGTHNVLELTRHAAELQVDALSAVPPFFYQTDVQGLHDYYDAIAKESGLPLLCYNVPGLTGVEINCAIMESLLDIPGFVGLKYSAYDHFDMASIIALDGGRLTVLSGNDEVFLGALAMGAHGGVGLNHNYIPRTLVRIYRNFHAGNIDAARRDQIQVNRIVQVLWKYGSFPVMKHIMKRKGMDCGPPRRPIRPLTDDEAAALDQLIDPIDVLWEDCR